MPLHPPITFSKPLQILNKGLGAVLLCVVSSATWAQPAPVPPANSVCEPAEDWPHTLECLSEKTGFIDIALQDSLRQLHEKLPPELRESLQTQQRDWEQRRDTDCTPTDRPASDSNALAYAMLCRSKMALQRTKLLQSLLDASELPPAPTDMNCPQEQAMSLPCLQKRQAVIENGMNGIYRSLLIRLPESQAQNLYAEQSSWEEDREAACQRIAGAHESADQAVCHFVMAMERVKVFREVWSPLAKKNQTKRQP